MSESSRILSQRFEVSKRYTFGVVVLSQGKRLDDLNRGFESLLAQKGVDLDIVCVGNGWEPEGIPDQVKKLGLPENLGIPAGRNAGVPHVDGEFLFFLDDDAWLPDDTSLMRMAQLMRTKPQIGLIQPRVEEPGGPDAPKRWIPRLKKGSADHSSNVFSVWEGAVCMQRRAFDECGGWPAPFWYAHEGIELAWRVWDAGLHRLVHGRPRRRSPSDRPEATRRILLHECEKPSLAGPTEPAVAFQLGLCRLVDVDAIHQVGE